MNPKIRRSYTGYKSLQFNGLRGGEVLDKKERRKGGKLTNSDIVIEPVELMLERGGREGRVFPLLFLSSQTSRKKYLDRTHRSCNCLTYQYRHLRLQRSRTR